jgi:hypothetical protein
MGLIVCTGMNIAQKTQKTTEMTQKQQMLGYILHACCESSVKQ